MSHDAIAAIFYFVLFGSLFLACLFTSICYRKVTVPKVEKQPTEPNDLTEEEYQEEILALSNTLNNLQIELQALTEEGSQEEALELSDTINQLQIGLQELIDAEAKMSVVCTMTSATEKSKDTAAYKDQALSTKGKQSSASQATPAFKSERNSRQNKSKGATPPRSALETLKKRTAKKAADIKQIPKFQNVMDALKVLGYEKEKDRKKAVEEAMRKMPDADEAALVKYSLSLF